MARTTRSERDELNEEAERIFGKDAPFITGRYGYYAIDEKKGGSSILVHGVAVCTIQGLGRSLKFPGTCAP